MLWDVCNSALTWLEFPVHISGMSQSLTASRQSTPTNSSYRNSTIIIKITHTNRRLQSFLVQLSAYLAVLTTETITAFGSLSQHTFHAAVLSFSSTLLQKDREKKTDYISSVRLMWLWCWCKITHGWASTVTLFSCLHKTISTLWRIQELQNRKVLCYFAHFYLFINCTIIIIHTYDLFSYVMRKRL